MTIRSTYVHLTANAVTRVALTGPFDFVDVINEDGQGSAPIYFTFSSQPATTPEVDAGSIIEPADPTVRGNDTLQVGSTAGASRRVRIYGKNVVVKMICSNTPYVAVIGGTKGDEV